MLYEAMLFLPTMVCILYLNLYVRRTRKTSVQWLMLAVLILTAIYTAADSLYILSDSNFIIKLVADIVCTVAMPLLPLVGVFALCKVANIDYEKHHWEMLILVPIVIICTIGTLFLIAGWDNVVGFENALGGVKHANPLAVVPANQLPEGYQTPVYFWIEALTGPLYYILIIIELLGVAIFCLYQVAKRKEKLFQVFGYIFLGKESNPFYLISVIYFWYGLLATFRICAGYRFLETHPAVTVIYSICLVLVVYCLLYLGLMAHIPHFTLAEVVKPLLFEQNQGESTAIAITTDTPSNKADEQDGQSAISEEAPVTYQELTMSLEKLMTEEQLFLNPNITIEDVAAELFSNRVYVSRAVNMVLGSTFREYINRKRIEYAKQYMIDHPELTQEVIASNCGFGDASAFNRKFRQHVGCTPREWLDHGCK